MNHIRRHHSIERAGRRFRAGRYARLKQLTLETLENRLAPSTYFVSTTADSGPGSLRQAITDANGHSGADLITFTTTGTIDLLSALPTVTDSLDVGGPGASAVTVERSASAPTTPEFSIFRFAAGTTDSVSGLTIAHGTGTRTGGSLPDTGPQVSGGGIDNAGTLTVQASVFLSNSVRSGAPALGGGIASTGPLTVIDSTFSGNQAVALGPLQGQGGAIYAATDLTVRDSVFDGNAAVGNPGLPGSPGGNAQGGAVYLAGGPGHILGSTLVGNTAAGGQGGTGPTGAGGGGTGQGGGIYLGGGSLEMVNDTVTQNVAQGGNAFAGGHGATITAVAGSAQGGGIYGGATLSMTNCTVSGNSVVAGTSAAPPFNGQGQGGGLFSASSSLLTNTILASNFTSNTGPDGQGTVAGDFNLVRDPSGITFASNPTHTIVGQDPRLDQLRDNGGPTPTRALLPGSPAIDAGTTGGAPAVDQRGQPRGIPDIGAFEAHPWVSAVPDQFTSPGTPLTVPFQVGDAALFSTEPITSLTASSSDQTLVPNSGLTITGSGSQRSLTITPADSRTGATQITITVQANGHQMSDTFNLTVEAGNHQTIAAVGLGPDAAVFVVTPAHDLYRHDVRGWQRLGGNIAWVTAVGVPAPFGSRPAQLPVVFAVTEDGALGAFADNTGWQIIGAPGTIRAASAGTDRTGFADAFVLTTANELTEWSTAGGWLSSPIGGANSILSMAALNRDRVDVITNDHSLFRFDPQAGGWFRLAPTGFAARSLSAVVDPSGNPTDFVVMADQALVRLDSAGQAQIGGQGSIRFTSAGLDQAGRPNVFALTTADDFSEYRFGWEQLGGRGTIRTMSAADADRVFVITADGSVFGHDPVSGWYPLAGTGFAEG